MSDGGSYFRLKKQSAHFVPPAGHLNLWMANNGHLYSTDEDGVDRDIHGQQGADGSSIAAVTAPKTADYAASISELVRVDSTAGDVTITLPSAVGNGRKSVYVKYVGSANTVIVEPAALETIEGEADYALTRAGQSVHFLSDGVDNWVIVGNTVSADTGPDLIANEYPGADLSEKIVAALADLSSGPGRVLARPGDYEWNVDKVVIGDHQHVRLANGLITLRTASNAVLLKDGASFKGSGWGTRIWESDDAVNAESSRIFRDYNAGLANNTDAAGNTDIEIADFQVIGRTLWEDSVRGTVNLGNIRRARVANIFLNSTSSIGIVVGGTSNTDNHASDFWVEGCHLYQVSSQGIAVVNGKSFTVNRNIIRNPSRLSGANGCPIDLEANSSEDILEAFTISNNVIDARGSEHPANAILVQAAGSVRARDGLIVGNTIFGGGYYPDTITSATVVPFFLSGCEDTLVTANNVVRCGQAAVSLASCRRVTVNGNRFTNVGGAANQAMVIDDSQYCNVINNQIHSPGAPNNSADSVRLVETGTSDYNYFKDNYVTQKAEDYSQTTQDPKIVLVGANSKAFHNNLKGYSVGRGYPVSIADLRKYPTPIEGAGRELVEVEGDTLPGDGGNSIWYWDDASTATDDGVTVVEPDNFDPVSGRWRRAKQWLELTTAERDAVTAFQGLTIYNTTDDVLQFYDGAAWVDCGGVGGSGDMLLGTAQTVTAAKTFQPATLKQNNAGNTFATTLASAATANRTWTLPDATDTAVGLAASQVLTNKTLTAPLVANLVSSSSAPALTAGASGLLGTLTSTSVVGTNECGVVSFTTGTIGANASGNTAAAAEILKLTFSSGFTAPNGCVVHWFAMGADSDAAAQNFADILNNFQFDQRHWGVGTTTTASLYWNTNSATSWANTTAYKVGYIVRFY